MWSLWTFEFQTISVLPTIVLFWTNAVASPKDWIQILLFWQKISTTIVISHSYLFIWTIEIAILVSNLIFLKFTLNTPARGFVIKYNSDNVKSHCSIDNKIGSSNLGILSMCLNHLWLKFPFCVLGMIIIQPNT